MQAKTLMIQGTASSVGKSILTAALCRIFRQDGYRVAPFKAQNMSNNSFITKEGGEIGRAQAMQAESAGIEPSIHMNPVLIKPEADNRSQIVVSGKADRRLDAQQYYTYTPQLLKVIENSLDHLRSEYDIIVIEGAGSPAEINLKEREIVNMRIARIAQAPVLLVGDIDRGGVFASIVGTLELLDQEERDRIKGIIINKFRGDIALLKPGLEMLEGRCDKPVLGVISFFHDIVIAQEDAVYLENKPEPNFGGDLEIVILHLPRVSNYDDFDPLAEHGCNVRYINSMKELDRPDLIILPGTKSTIADLVYLRQQGLAEAIVSMAESGTPVFGICGGYQMLGNTIHDPYHVESFESSIPGLGLLDCDTTFNPDKTTRQVKASVISNHGLLKGLRGINLAGYEIHMGQDSRPSNSAPFSITSTTGNEQGHYDGMINSRGNVLGTYIHGLFHNNEFTLAFLNRLRQMRNLPPLIQPPFDKQEQYDKLASTVRNNLNMDQIYRITFGNAYGN